MLVVHWKNFLDGGEGMGGWLWLIIEHFLAAEYGMGADFLECARYMSMLISS